jgi:hypothetical protein
MIAIQIIKRYNNKDYPGGNVASALEKLKHNYEPKSALSMVKLDR